MNKTLQYTIREAAGIAGDTTRFCLGSLVLPAVAPIALAGAALFSAAPLGTWLATEAGRPILAELRRRARLRTPRPPSPSIRGTPTPEELTADVRSLPRTLHIRLRIGFRLADLAPTLDTSNHYDTSPTGARRIAARGRGVKGWLEDNRITVNYSTLMRYKRLAIRLRALLALDERLPLEWLLPGTVPDHPIPSALLTHYRTAKRKLTALLHTHRNFSRLSKHVDTALGIPKLLQARRATKRTKISSKAARLPLPSVTVGDCTIALHPKLVESTQRELALFLKTPDLPPKLDALRRRALDGLSTQGIFSRENPTAQP